MPARPGHEWRIAPRVLDEQTAGTVCGDGEVLHGVAMLANEAHQLFFFSGYPPCA